MNSEIMMKTPIYGIRSKSSIIRLFPILMILYLYAILQTFHFTNKEKNGTKIC